MTSRELAEALKGAVTARQAAEYYGFHPDRAGFIRCPFHAGDDHGSLKIYDGDRGWHCFGCGRGGSVIDFVMELFDQPFAAACRRMDADFGLGLLRERTFADRRKASRQREARRASLEERQAKRTWTDSQYRVLARYRRWLAAQEQTPATQVDLHHMDRLLDRFLPADSEIPFDAAARVNALLSKHPNRGDYHLPGRNN